MIPQEFIEEIQQRTDIVDLISGYIPLKRAGRNFKALCPFHNEKTPSFFVSPQRQIFHCFGCGKGGGVLQFLMLYERMNFVEAVELLAKRAGVSIPYQRSSPKDRLKIVLYEVVEEASRFFHSNLISSNEGKEARGYLQKRGIDEDIIKLFHIGYAPLGNRLIGYMRKKGITLDILEKASLVVTKEGGGYSDLFRDRIIFPICDIRKRTIGFGARALKDKEGLPKYINSFENSIYNKRRHLFGLHLAKEEIISKDSVVVTEGYLDMITPFKAGIKNIVASLGTALTIEQIQLIKRYASRVILVFDSDKAGESATLRALDLLLGEGLKTEVVRMPEGLDLDLAIRKNGVEFVKSLLDKRVDFFDYKIEMLRRLYDVESIEGKAKVAQQMLITISRLTSEVEKYEYIKKLSTVLRVKEAALFSELRKVEKEERGIKREMAASLGKEEPVPIAEKIIIKSMLANKKVFSALKDKLNADDFSHSLSKKTFMFFIGKAQHGHFTYSDFLISTDDSAISSFVSEIMMDETIKVDKDTLRECVVKLKRNRIKAIKEQLRDQLRIAENLHDTKRTKELIEKFNKINSEVRNG